MDDSFNRMDRSFITWISNVCALFPGLILLFTFRPFFYTRLKFNQLPNEKVLNLDFFVVKPSENQAFTKNGQNVGINKKLRTLIF